MVQLSQALAAILLATGVVAHPGGNINREIMRRQAHLDHPNRRSVQECKRDLVESGWVREQHLRREARLHELRVAAGFAKEHEIVRRDPAEVEENYGTEAACTLDPEAGEGPYCKQEHKLSPWSSLTTSRGQWRACQTGHPHWREGCHHSPRHQHHRRDRMQACD
jgi:hypothetical protein